MKFRTYHEVHGEDRSQLLAQVVHQRARVAERLAAVRHVAAVMSGKGGVGKSFVTAALAEALASRGAGVVGVLDADLNGPTVARLLGARGPVTVHDDGAEPVTGRHGVKVFSADLLLDEDRPLSWREPESERFVWRGTLETGVLREFLSDVAWGALDLLLVDLPPGAGHVGDLAELVPGMRGAVAVTIPSEESRRSVARAMQAARDAGVRLLGVVENMSGYACTECATTRPLFDGDAGAQLAARFGVPLLGRVPFHPAATPGDQRRPKASEGEPQTLASCVVDAFWEALG